MTQWIYLSVKIRSMYLNGPKKKKDQIIVEIAGMEWNVTENDHRG